MIPIFSNNATSTLVGSLTSIATSFAIQSADAAKFPQPTDGQYFMVVLENTLTNPVQREICQCTGIAGNTLTVVRGQEGTSAQTFPAGATVSNRLTAATLNYLIANLNVVQPQYIGADPSAPTTMPDGTTLVPGSLYFNTTSNQLFEWTASGVWQAVTVNEGTLTSQLYLGEFATPPTTMNDGTPLVLGALYWNTATIQLYEYSGSWEAVVDVNNIIGNVAISGNLTVGGTTALSNTNVVGTLTLNGLALVAQDQLSGTASSQYFPDGNFMQWGMSETNSDLVFPTPYTTNIDVVLATVIGASGGSGIPGCVVSVYNVTLAGCSFYGYNPGDGSLANRPIYWFTFGK